MPIRSIAISLVDWCRRHAGRVALGALLVSLLLGWYVVTNLSMDTDQEHLIDENLPWRQTETALDQAFPQNVNTLVIVLDGPSAGLAEAAAADLAAALATRPDLFISVRRPDALPYFRRNALLFLSVDELQELADRLIEAQPLIGALTADPSLRGLLGALDLALEGIERGDATFADLEAPLTAIADATEGVLAGRPAPVEWQTLLTGRDVGAGDRRRFIVAQPVLDHGALSPGAKPSAFVRQSAQELGITPENGYRVRLTGSVALADEEFATVGEGMGVAALLSLLIVALLLFLALRSLRLIVPILLTLIVGLIVTGAFATLAFGALNLISVAFAVLFVGLAVDFGIQVSVRFRDEHYRQPDVAEALRRCAGAIAGPLLLAAGSTMVGFFSFMPTAYVGVSELGAIAGVGMIIAVLLNLTLLPALLVLLRPPGEASPAGYAWLAGADRLLTRLAPAVLVALAVLVVASAVIATQLRFDFNPLNLKDEKSESAATMLELFNDPNSAPYTAKILAPSLEEAEALGARLKELPEVADVLTLRSFIPKAQDEKLPIIEDAHFLLAPTLSPPEVAPPPDEAALREALAATARNLRSVGGAQPDGAVALRLADAFDRVLQADPATIGRLAEALVGGALSEIAILQEALQAQPVALEDITPDLARDWVTEDGRAVVEVVPEGDARDNAVLERFADAVTAVAPQASGTPVTIQQSGRTVVGAFRIATVLALVAIAVILAAILRRAVDVMLVLAPPVLGGLFTAATCVLIDLPITFANIIVLPLLLGIGVAYGVYYVMNWRAGVREPLQSSTTRAVLFSALTTGVAFGSLAASRHPGTAGMGILLSVSLAYTLLAAMVFLPALMAWLRRRNAAAQRA